MKGMARACAMLALLHFFTSRVFAQDPINAFLFDSEQPISLRLSISLRDVKRKTNDSTYIPAMLSFQSAPQRWDSMQVAIRSRGNFRKKHCFFPPIRMKFKKKDTQGTLFEGTKSLKLVMPCQSVKTSNDLILKEYMCYQLYEAASPYVFKTRLIDITLSDLTVKGVKTYQLKGIFIEDDDAAAERYNAKVFDQPRFDPFQFQDTSSIRLDLFEYMIANTDFSTTFLHNIKAIQTNNGFYIPLAYDFDMSGVVNAPYATFDEKLGIKSVRERVYKGYCRDGKVAEAVRKEYLDREQSILDVISGFEEFFEPKEIVGMKKYLSEFFTVIVDDRSYHEKITSKCRPR